MIKSSQGADWHLPSIDKLNGAELIEPLHFSMLARSSLQSLGFCSVAADSRMKDLQASILGMAVSMIYSRFKTHRLPACLQV